MSARHAPVVAAALLAAAGLLTSCALGPGYGDGYVGVGYVGDYYEPWGYDYGGWGGRYHVGPPPGGRWRGGGGHPVGGGRPGGGYGGGHGGGGGRSAPSIPGRPR
jgi:hypothetical protein